MKTIKNAGRLTVSLVAVIMLFTFFTMLSFATGDTTPIEFEQEEISVDMSEECNYRDKDRYDSSVYYTLELKYQSGVPSFFSSSKKSVAKIDEEDEDSVTLQLLKSGTTVIRAHNEEGEVAATCTVNVSASLKDIDIKAFRSDDYDYDYEYNGSIAPGKMLQLKAYACPSFADEPVVTWSSSNEECATVDENGLVTLIKHGPVTITAETTGDISAEYPIVWSERVTSGAYTYRVKNANEITIESYNDEDRDKEIVIPEEIDGYTVTGIDGFNDSNYLEKVTIPHTVTTIGYKAFESCAKLRIVIFNCDADISERAFEYCRYLMEVQFNGAPKYIGPYAFHECDRLEKINIPEGVEEIDERAFAYSGLKSIKLPKSLKKIGSGVFNSANVDSLEIGENVESIEYTGGVAKYNVVSTNPYFSSKGGVLFNKSGKKLLRYPGKNEAFHYSVPSGTEIIGEGALSGASNLRQLDFPETVVTIEESALPNRDWGNTEIVFPKSISTIEKNNISNAEYYKLYYKGSAADWDKIYIDYLNNDGLTRNNDIVWNHKKKGIKLAKTSVSCTYAEHPKVKITYSDGSNVKKDKVNTYSADGVCAYASREQEGAVTYLRIYADSYPKYRKGTTTICIVADGYAADIKVNVTGPTPLSKCTFTWGFVSGKYGNPVYDGKAQKPWFELRTADGSRIYSDNYTVKYQNNKKIGTAKVIITGKNNCTGSITKTFQIVPETTYLFTPKPAKKALNIEWSKQTKQTSGYQIQYSLKKNFKGAKTITINNNKTTKRKITKLKSKKKYYLRARTFKKVGSKKIYSNWTRIMTGKPK